LLVADLDVAPNEEIEELAVLPDFVEAQLKPATRGLDPDPRDRDCEYLRIRIPSWARGQ